MRFELALGVAILVGCAGGESGGDGGSSPPAVAAAIQNDGPPSVPATGATYYVSPTGNNANPGTLASPWRTPGYGSRKLKAGDTLVILGGNYTLSAYDDDILDPPSGTAANWVVIRGEEGNRPILRGKNNLLTAVDLGGAKYVKLQNLEIRSDNGAWFRDGIEALGSPAEHILLQDLYIHHVDEFGINAGDVQDLQVYNCVVRYCGFGSLGGPEGAQGGWKNVLISGCTLSYSGHYYHGGAGPSPYDRPDGFGIEASNGPVEIRKTRAEHNRGDGLDSKAANTYIHECVVANNSCDGVKLWGGGSKVENTLIYGRGDGSTQATPWSAVVIATQQSGATFQFVNVTIDDVVGKNYVMHVQYDDPAIPVALTMRNCILSSRGSNAPIWLSGAVNATFTNDLFYFPFSSEVVWKGATSYSSTQVGQLGSGNVYGNPLFVGSEDYHLKSGSPAINAGSSSAPAQDLDGVVRPQGGAVDMGAFEK